VSEAVGHLRFEDVARGFGRGAQHAVDRGAAIGSCAPLRHACEQAGILAFAREHLALRACAGLQGLDGAVVFDRQRGGARDDGHEVALGARGLARIGEIRAEGAEHAAVGDP
jgi:hypothetical protein